jgi:hypothetical protein
MDASDLTALGRADDEDAALAAESALLAEEDAADRAARTSGSPPNPGAGDGSPVLDPLGIPDEEDAGDVDDSDPGMPIEDVDVDEGVDELGEAPEGEELTTDEHADIAQQLAAIREANEHLPPDQQISTSPEDVN